MGVSCRHHWTHEIVMQGLAVPCGLAVWVCMCQPPCYCGFWRTRIACVTANPHGAVEFVGQTRGRSANFQPKKPNHGLNDPFRQALRSLSDSQVSERPPLSDKVSEPVGKGFRGPLGKGSFRGGFRGALGKGFRAPLGNLVGKGFPRGPSERVSEGSRIPPISALAPLCHGLPEELGDALIH